MKKALKMLIPVVVFAMIFSVIASALSGINSDEQRVLDFINAHKQVKVGRATYELKEEYINHARNVLNRDPVDLTKDQADALIAQMEELLKMCAAYDVDSAKALSSTQRESIRKEMQDCADVVNNNEVKLVVELNAAQDTLTIRDEATTTRFNTVVNIQQDAIQTTGSDSNVWIIVSVSAVLALICGAYILNKKKVND